ncbi:MAG: hypothetical protein QW046_04925 [Candidatus Micrarchaeaceae archaeon]
MAINILSTPNLALVNGNHPLPEGSDFLAENNKTCEKRIDEKT